jgi:transposase-like protein
MVDIRIKQRAVEMYAEGCSALAAAKALGVGHNSVIRWVESAGVKRTISETRGCTDGVKRRAVEMYRGGMSSPEVSDALGVSMSSVQTWAKEAGVIRTMSAAKYRGGNVNKKGYCCILKNGRLKFMHREIAEAVLARPLTSIEVVHHVNGCRSDNRPANLWVFPTDRDHHEFHHTGTIHPDTIKLIPYCGEAV